MHFFSITAFLTSLFFADAAGAAASLSKSLAPALDADDVCRGKSCATELMQLRASKHHSQPVLDSDVRVDYSTASIDTIKPQPLPVLGDNEVTVQSAIPVFTSKKAYIALLFPNRNSSYVHQDGFWNKTKDVKHFCRTTDGTHEAIMEKFGGEYNKQYEWEVVWKCAWPMERNLSRCHSVVVVEEAELQDKRVLGTVQACDGRTANVAGDFQYELAACVKPLWENAGSLHASGLIKLPQWLEYHVMHGVQHFMIYTVKSSPDQSAMLKAAQPFFKAGLASHVEVDMNWVGDASSREENRLVQLAMENDCLYRYKGRAPWVMPSVDVDEYLNTAGQTNETLITDLLPLPRSSVYAVTLMKYQHIVVSDPMTMLDIESTRREERPEPSMPKYIANTAATNVCWTHWVQSWVPGTTDLALAMSNAHLHHYRLLSSDGEVEVTDDTLAREQSTLRRRLQTRYGMPWKELQASLHVGIPSLYSNSSILHDVDGTVSAPSGEVDIEKYADFIKMLQNLKQDTMVQSPR